MTFNVITLNTINQLVVFAASIADKNIDVISILEHRYYCSVLELKFYEFDYGWTSVLASAWKNYVNVITEGVRRIPSTRALKIAK